MQGVGTVGGLAQAIPRDNALLEVQGLLREELRREQVLRRGWCDARSADGMVLAENDSGVQAQSLSWLAMLAMQIGRHRMLDPV